MANPIGVQGSDMDFEFGILKSENKEVQNSIMIFICNETRFAFVHQALSFQENINFDFSDHHVVILAPIQAGKNISITATTILNLSRIKACFGEINIITDKVFKNIEGSVEANGDIRIITPKSLDINIDIILDRKEMILELFKDAIQKMNGELAIDALVETYHAIRDPKGDNPPADPEYMIDAMQFFGIPSR